MTYNVDVQTNFASYVRDFLRSQNILPAGYQCEVRLYGKKNKKHEGRRFHENWNPDTDSIRITFAPEMKPDRANRIPDAPATVEEGFEETMSSVTESRMSDPSEERLLDLVRAVARAESRPGYDFVSLKWFRDAALPQEKYSWASEEAARHDVIREAIDRRWVLTSKVANPRSPSFPVTAIRLNRQSPEVGNALGTRASAVGFRPVRIRGASLSSTVLGDRR